MTGGYLIQECRMETAMRMLRDSTLPVEEVALLVGYDVRSLQRQSRAWCGLSPSTLRGLARRRRQLLSSCDEAFSWYFWRRFCLGLLSEEELQPVIECLQAVYDEE